MNYFDIVIGIVLAFSLVQGFRSGFVMELATLAAFVLGVYGAVNFSWYAQEFLQQHINGDYIGIIAFVLTFILIVIVVNILGRLIHRLVNVMLLGVINRLLGAVFALAKYAFVLSVLLSVFNSLDKKLNLLSDNIKKDSLFYEPLSEIAPMMFPHLEKLIDNKKLNNDAKVIEV